MAAVERVLAKRPKVSGGGAGQVYLAPELARVFDASEKIADKAVRVLREGEELAELARAEGQPLHGELRMGVIPTIAPFLLPAMLPRLRISYPILIGAEQVSYAMDALGDTMGALPFSVAPALAPAVLAAGDGSYGVLYAVAGASAHLSARACTST